MLEKITGWLNERIERGIAAASARVRLPFVSAPIQKATRDFASMAVPATGGQQAPAGWLINRNEHVRHWKGATYVAAGAIARKIAGQTVKVQYETRNEKSGSVEWQDVEWDHPLAVLYRSWNPIYTEWEMWYMTVGWLLVCGDTYLWKNRNGLGMPAELWPLPAQWVQAIPGTNFIDAYQVRGVWASERQIKRQDVVHAKLPALDWNGAGRFNGWPPMAAGAEEIDNFESIIKRQWGQFKNYVPPGLIFSLKQELSPEQFEQACANIYAVCRIAEQYRAPIIVQKDTTVTDNANTPREMDYGRSLDAAFDMVLAIYGTPRAVVGLVKDTNRCLDADTECLTANGWKKHHELTFDTRVAAYDTDSGTIVYRKPTGIYVSDYNGPMHSWRDEVCDITVTPEHRLIGRRGESIHESYPFETMTADQWSKKSRFRVLSTAPNGAACEPAIAITIGTGTPQEPRHLIVPDTDSEFIPASMLARMSGISHSAMSEWCRRGILKARTLHCGGVRQYIVGVDEAKSFVLPHRGGPLRSDITIDADDWMEFLGWFIAEGSTSIRNYTRRDKPSTNWTIFLCQKPGRKAEKIQSLLDRMPLKWHVCTTGSGMLQWACNDKGLCEHLRSYCGTSCDTKTIPSYVKDYPAHSLQILLDAYLEGDGHYHDHAYWSADTVSKQLADDLHEVAIKCGWRSMLHNPRLPKGTNRMVAYHVSINKTKQIEYAIRKKRMYRQENYVGKIWCVQVPTGYFVVRRNGKVHITGNSNMESALLTWADNTLNPMLEMMGQRHTKDIGKEFDERIRVYFDPITVEDAQRIRDDMRMAADTGAVTPNEIREVVLRRPPLAVGGDQVVNPLMREAQPLGNVEPVDSPVDEAEGVPTLAETLDPAQITLINTIVGQVEAGTIPRDAAEGQLKVLFGLDETATAAVLGSAGMDETPEEPSVPVIPQMVGEQIGDQPSNGQVNRIKSVQSNGHIKKKVQERLEIAKRWLAKQADAEKPFAKDVHRELLRLKRQVLSRIGGTQKARRKSPVPDDDGKRMRRVANKHIEKIMIDGVELEYEETNRRSRHRTDIPDGVMDGIRETIDDTFDEDYWKENFSKATRERVAGYIEKNTEAGGSVSDLAELIEEDKSGVFSETRAWTVARTEATGALNGGQWVARQQLIEDGVVVGEEWISTEDDATREDHVDANGQKIKAGDRFKVGSETARYPGDPELSAGNRVNCRCTSVSLIEGELDDKEKRNSVDKAMD